MHVSIADEFGNDDAKRRCRLQVQTNRLDGTCEFHIMVHVKFWKIVTERRDVGSKAYDFVHSDSKQVIKHLREPHHPEGDGSEGKEAVWIMFSANLRGE